MNRPLAFTCTTLMLCAVLGAQDGRAPEQLNAWQYYKEVLPVQAAPGLTSFLLDRDMLERAKHDGADLRVYDRAGHEIPYVFRVLSDVSTSKPYQVRIFDRGVVGGSAQLSCDLGDQVTEHNEVTVVTKGTNFRRLAEVQGSPDNVRWSVLASKAILFRFEAGGRAASEESISYPVSRYRYLRVIVGRDPQVDQAAPEITTVTVQRSVHRTGETVPFTGYLGAREPDRANSRPASVWRVDFGARVPVSRVVLTAEDPAFSRPFEIQAVDDPTTPVSVASGEIMRKEGAEDKPLTINFSETYARHLKLIVTDDRNSALTLTGVTGFSTARQVILNPPPPEAYPLHVYYGNIKSPAPNYDLSARLPDDPVVAARMNLGPQLENPNYTPAPKPISERSPWLVYVILGLASLVLAAILVNLARKVEASSAEPIEQSST